MPSVDLTLSVEINRTPRVKQIEGIFDVPEKKRGTVEYSFDVPFEERDWSIGLIHGPSGGGKTSVAKALFEKSLVSEYEWPKDKAIVDGFGDTGVRDITAALGSVGFASPPSWVKPYSVLSNGEKFRANLARCITDERDLVAVDEFTSVVDRTVARIGSNAVARAIRAKKRKRFVAISCHDDIIEWLQPDWTLEPHIGRFHWRSVRRRPDVQLEIVRVHHQAWAWFAQHHYMTRMHHKAAQCFAALIDGSPVAFASILHQPHPKTRRIKRVHRVVVLPDYQGLGLANHLMEFLGSMGRALGWELRTYPAHPALVRSQAKSVVWDMVHNQQFSPVQGNTTTLPDLANAIAWDRRIAVFRYCGPAMDVAQARRLWNEHRRGEEIARKSNHDTRNSDA